MRRMGAIILVLAVAGLWIGSAPVPEAEAVGIPRGDCDGNGVLNIADAVLILNILFPSPPPPPPVPIPCRLGPGSPCDVNNSGALDIADAVYLLSYLFVGGPPPALPNPC